MAVGPDLLDASLTEHAFRERIRKHRGQVKSILTNEEFVAGVGNAYSDEILWAAEVHPYRKRTELTDDEIGRIYRACHDVMEWAIPQVWEQVKDNIDAKPRDFLKVHRKGGQPCPRCGTTISEITASQRITSFCRQCQPETPGGKG
jgi:formamidopyrimidine-DNA glycosylase